MLIVKKPCSFGGKRFFIGDTIPDELVDCPKLQEDRGVLSIVGASNAENVQNPSEDNVLMTVRLEGKNGFEAVSVRVESVSEVIRLLQLASDEVTGVLSGTDDGDLLTIMDACDSRKAVRTAARARLAALKEAGDA